MPRRDVATAFLVAAFSSIAGMPSRATVGAATPPTWNADIAPLVADRCAPCHRPDGSGPFPLLTFDDVARRARLAADLVERGRMPPWLPEQGAETFVGARQLTAEQKRMFRDWVSAGLPRGESGAPVVAIPADPRPAWELGEPDLVAESSASFELPADGGDVYRAIVVPVPVTTRRYVRGIEFRTTAPGAVHHAVVGLDRTGTARWLDARDAGAGFDGRLTGPTQSPDGHFLGWTPGRRPTFLPSDLAWTLDPGTDLVVQLHLVPSGRTEHVGLRIGLHFTDTPPARRPVLVRVGSMRIDIPPGATGYTTRDEFELPVDVDALSVYPHAHLRATRVTTVARASGGGSGDLLRINRWDFAWQDEYRFVSPRRLPRGTRISAEFVYDNAASNAANAGGSPRVLYGPRTTDEMGDVWIQVVARTDADRAALVRTLAAREFEASLEAYQRLVRARPEEPEHHLTLGMLLGKAGRGVEAVRHYREALRLSPDQTLPKYNLAVGLQATGGEAEAERLLLEVVAAEPGHAEAWHALGHAAIARGDRAAARDRLTRAVSAWPGFADAHVTLGTLLASMGDAAGAEAEFRRAVEASPDHLVALNDLAIVLAGRGAVSEAIALLERAVSLDPAHAASRQNLAAARGGR